ncbi:MAG: RNA pseudouridine synthase [Polyangiales bacterium]
MSASVLFRDARWLALDKPAGVVTTPNVPGAPSLIDLARAVAPDAGRLHPINRLDLDVSGVVLFALDDRAIAAHESARAQGPQARGYVALVSPAPSIVSGAWDRPIGLHPSRRGLRAVNGRDAEPARTEYRVVEARGAVAWLALSPLTGRTHQLRVHCAAAGCPVLGDRDYGGARRCVTDDGAVHPVERVMLHAAWRQIPGSDWRVESPPPREMAALWATLGGLAGRDDLR